jgi:hypothetical protein
MRKLREKDKIPKNSPTPCGVVLSCGKRKFACGKVDFDWGKVVENLWNTGENPW